MLRIDLDGDGQPEQVLLSDYLSQVFVRENGQWRAAGRLQGGNLGKLNGKQAEQWTEQGVATQPPRWHDLVIGGERYSVRPED